MFFLNKKEVNYELYYKNTFIRILINKKNYSNKYVLTEPKIDLFFWVRRIKEENLSLLNLYNNCIFLWLITGNLGKIKNLNIKLVRGLKYYRYVYICNTTLFYKVLNLLIELFTPIFYKNLVNKHINNKNIYLISYKDLSVFTNLKLSNFYYLNSVNDKLFLRIKSNNKNINLKLFLNCLKIR